MHYQIVIPGRPVPAVRMTQSGKYKKRNAQRYLQYREEVGWRAKAKVKKPLEGPVGIEVIAYWTGGQPGDLDNIVKAIQDGCNGVVWIDDTQVVEIHAYRRNGVPQRAELKVWQLG